MEPRIQYAQTKDGVSIAFWTLGHGVPYVTMPNLPFSHIELEWQIPEFRRWYELQTQKRNVIRYDNRGSGLSDRDVTDYSIDAQTRDLEAVVDGLGLQRFALSAPLLMGPVAIAYAVRQPERVSHLVLWCSFARMSDYFASPVVQTLAAMRDKDWVLYTETVAHAALGWAEGEPARQYAALMRECVTQDASRAMFDALGDVDVSGLLAEVKSPTLVLHRRQVTFPGIELARGLASKIPGAQLALLEGTSLAPFLGDAETVVNSTEEFLGVGEDEVPTKAEVPEAGAFRTILFTDVEDSTALTQRLGDDKARDVLRTHERIVREALAAHGGAEVKTMGDGFMVSFPSATRALECAVTLQRAFAAHNESAAEPILVRVGLNAGEPIAEEADLFGTAVIVAARITAQASGGEILASEAVRQVVAGKGFLFADRGETALRGFEDPVRLYEVRWQEG